MTAPQDPTREALPDPLKVVAWLTSWPKDRIRPAGTIVNRQEPQQKFDCNQYSPLVRLTDALSALESERQAHAAEVERLRGALDRVKSAGIPLANFVFNLAQHPGRSLNQRECGLIDLARQDWDQAIAKEKP